MYLGMDLHICCADRPYGLDNLNLVHILDGSLYMDRHDIREDNYIFRCYTEHLVRKVMGYRDLHLQGLSLKYFNLIVESCHCYAWFDLRGCGLS